MFNGNKLPILGILRGIEEKDIKPLADVCIAAGLDYLEITMNTKNAVHLINQMVESVAGKIMIGAGTVMNLNELEHALEAKAKFIVSPNLSESVIKECVLNEIPVFPGALTPTEVYKAWGLGATMVKLFPASVFGPSYIKELKAPLNSLKVMAVGGINENNISSYFDSGANAVAFGASIFKPEWMDKGRYDLIQNDLIKLIAGYRKKGLEV